MTKRQKASLSGVKVHDILVDREENATGERHYSVDDLLEIIGYGVNAIIATKTRLGEIKFGTGILQEDIDAFYKSVGTDLEKIAEQALHIHLQRQQVKQTIFGVVNQGQKQSFNPISIVNTGIGKIHKVENFKSKINEVKSTMMLKNEKNENEAFLRLYNLDIDIVIEKAGSKLRSLFAYTGYRYNLEDEVEYAYKEWLVYLFYGERNNIPKDVIEKINAKIN